MLRTLLESNAAPTRRRGGILVRVGLYAAVIALAVVATTGATSVGNQVLDGNSWRREAPIHILFPPLHHRSTQPVSKRTGNYVPGTYLDLPVIREPWGPTFPIKIPTTSPPIDNPMAKPDEDLFNRARFALGGVGEGSTSSTEGMACFDCVRGPEAVDKAAMPMAGNPTPIYPARLRSAQLEGSVIARFVVDSVGRAEPASIDILQATHPLFADAVRQALLHSRYEPAMVGNHRVRQLVDQRFTFSLIR